MEDFKKSINKQSTMIKKINNSLIYKMTFYQKDYHHWLKAQTLWNYLIQKSVNQLIDANHVISKNCKNGLNAKKQVTDL